MCSATDNNKTIYTTLSEQRIKDRNDDPTVTMKSFKRYYCVCLSYETRVHTRCVIREGKGVCTSTLHMFYMYRNEQNGHGTWNRLFIVSIFLWCLFLKVIITEEQWHGTTTHCQRYENWRKKEKKLLNAKFVIVSMVYDILDVSFS